MTLDHEYRPDVVRLLEGISKDIVLLWDGLIEWDESIRSNNWADKRQIEKCADAAMRLWSALVGACEICSVMTECPDSILKSMVEGVVLATTAREMDDAYHLLIERMEKETVSDLEQRTLIHRTREAILRYRLVLRLAGIKLDLQPMVQLLKEAAGQV